MLVVVQYILYAYHVLYEYVMILFDRHVILAIHPQKKEINLSLFTIIFCSFL